MKIFLCSDTHFGHTKLIEYCHRPIDFGTKILKALEVIGKNDMLIHLGDFCIGNDKDWHKDFFKVLKTQRVILVRGNHDNKSDSWYYDNGWDFVCKTFTAKHFGKKILFSHIPQRRITHGNYDINIHGHYHNADHRKRELK